MGTETRTRIDFLRWLEPDMAIKILAYLDDSADLIRASAVSQHWQNIVISNGLSKQLCIARYPELARITRVVKFCLERSRSSEETEHQAYASLFRAITAFPQTCYIPIPVSASSTDNYPEESIVNTLDFKDKFLRQYSYWSSKGSDDPEIPETLIYSLQGTICVTTEIDLHPFQASFQLDSPIYSSKYVRFRMGHPKSLTDLSHDFVNEQECADDKFIWTYTSPIFPVAQENRLQRFKLPEPVICIGGFLQIEFLGRVQKHPADGKYYICVTHVKAIGRCLEPAFGSGFSASRDSVYLMYVAQECGSVMRNLARENNCSLSNLGKYARLDAHGASSSYWCLI